MTSWRAADRWAAVIRRAAAAVFAVFGAGKFVDHASELASLREYGLPSPAVFVYVIGVLELAGAVLLATNLLVRPAALALAANLIGAIVVSGVGEGEGEYISLTLAPVLLAAMIFLLRFGGDDASLRSRAPV